MEVLSKHPFILCSPFSFWHGVVQLLPNSESKKVVLGIVLLNFPEWFVASCIIDYDYLWRMILVERDCIICFVSLMKNENHIGPFKEICQKPLSILQPLLFFFFRRRTKRKMKDWIPVSNFLYFWKHKPLMFNDQSRKHSSAITGKVHITVQNPTNSSVEPIIVNKKNSFCNPSILFLEGEAYVSSWCSHTRRHIWFWAFEWWSYISRQGSDPNILCI